MSSPNEIRVKLERDYRICMSKYERAELATETIVGVKALAAADLRIQAKRRVLKEQMEKLDYLLRLQVDPEWTPHHLTPLHVYERRRKGSISKEAYRVLKAARTPLKTHEIAHLVASALGVDRTDHRAISRISSSIASTLTDRHKEGLVERIEGKPIRWRVPYTRWLPSNAPAAFASVPVVRAAASAGASFEEPTPGASASSPPSPRRDAA